LFIIPSPASTRAALPVFSSTRRNKTLQFGAVSLQQAQQALGKQVDFLDQVSDPHNPQKRCQLHDIRAYSLNPDFTEGGKKSIKKRVREGKTIPGFNVRAPFDLIEIGISYPDNPSRTVTHKTFCVQNGEIKGLELPVGTVSVERVREALGKKTVKFRHAPDGVPLECYLAGPFKKNENMSAPVVLDALISVFMKSHPVSRLDCAQPVEVYSLGFEYLGKAKSSPHPVSEDYVLVQNNHVLGVDEVDTLPGKV
jgi:hypothetical protein